MRSKALLAGFACLAILGSLPLLAADGGPLKEAAEKTSAPQGPDAGAPVASPDSPDPDEQDEEIEPLTFVEEFGGTTVEYEFKVAGNKAKGTLYQNAEGDLRFDLRMRDPQLKAPISTSVIVLGGDPDTAFHLVHTTREAGRVDLPEPLIEQADDRYVIEDLGWGKVKKIPCRHVKLTDTKSGDTFELWLARLAGTLTVFDRALRSIFEYQGSIKLALSSLRVDGLPLKVRFTKRSTGDLTEGTAVKLRYGPVANHRFENPRGYRFTKMTSLNPLDQAAGAMKGLKKMFKGFAR